MRFDIVTIFKAMVEQAASAGIVGRAIERGTLQLTVHDLRDYTTDRHRVVDDVAYGGGPGMVLKPEPLFRALDAIVGEKGGHAGERGEPGQETRRQRPYVLLTSPQGTTLTQAVAQRLSQQTHLVVICGRYEGVDERVRTRVDEEISIGDYVLSGGELAALVLVDTVARLVPGVVGDEQSVVEDSFSRGLLDYPHYTRPADMADGSDDRLKVPDVLLSGNHAEIRRWRKREALARTLARRPELLDTATLDDEELKWLRELQAQRNTRVGG